MFSVLNESFLYLKYKIRNLDIIFLHVKVKVNRDTVIQKLAFLACLIKGSLENYSFIFLSKKLFNYTHIFMR